MVESSPDCRRKDFLAERMNMATLLESRLLTAEKYGRLPNDGRPTELVRGKIVESNRPVTSHGYLMSRITALLWQFVDQHYLGRVVSGDAGIITQRDPDSVLMRMWRSTVTSEFHKGHDLMDIGQPARNSSLKSAPKKIA